MVSEQPQHAVLGPVGWSRAHLTKQPLHRSPLSQRMYLAELRPSLTLLERHSEPQHAVAIPVRQGFVLITDPTFATLDHRDRRVLLGTPSRDVRRYDLRTTTTRRGQ
jgi:hypothetical protein